MNTYRKFIFFIKALLNKVALTSLRKKYLAGNDYHGTSLGFLAFINSLGFFLSKDSVDFDSLIADIDFSVLFSSSCLNSKC